MELELLRTFFGWCTVINFVLYAVSIIANLAMGTFYSSMIVKIFQVDVAEWRIAFLEGVANYKLLIIVFCFVPWLTLVIMTA
ncbi:MAG: DUF6868 family protein [Pseudomonadota bacterium]